MMVWLRLSTLLVILLACFATGPADAACTNPAGNEADQFYNGDYHTYQFCDGTSWLSYGGGSGCDATGGYAPTRPSGYGYFVLSYGTFAGNFNSADTGALTVADALCLTDLTTHTSWKGYVTANANGQLIGAKVHALLNDGTTTTGVTPLATYYFANGGDSSAGGASFTASASGVGPNDSANWAAANYFNGSYTYWTGAPFGYGTSTAWLTGGSYYSNDHCSRWTSGTGNTGVIGISNNTDANRWQANTYDCANIYHLLCFVNP